MSCYNVWDAIYAREQEAIDRKKRYEEWRKERDKEVARIEATDEYKLLLARSRALHELLCDTNLFPSENDPLFKELDRRLSKISRRMSYLMGLDD